jgi:hypothetical protein
VKISAENTNERSGRRPPDPVQGRGTVEAANDLEKDEASRVQFTENAIQDLQDIVDGPLKVLKTRRQESWTPASLNNTQVYLLQ